MHVRGCSRALDATEQIVRTLRRPSRTVALVQCCLFFLSTLIAAAPSVAAPPVATGSTPTHLAPSNTAVTAASLHNLQAEINLLKTQVRTVTGNVAAAEVAAKPVVQTGKGLVNAVSSFPNRVTAFRQKYGIPKNPSIDQEWRGIQRYLLERGGMSPNQAKVMAAKMANTPIIEHLKRPFRPESIVMAVGVTAGMNILSQMSSGEGFDFGRAVSFLGDQNFWGGMLGSGVAYGLASFAVASVLPPGVGILAALIPTFAGMAASAIGWEIGAANGKSMKEVLSNISVAELLGQAAGSTVGIVMGGQLALVLGGALGAIAGPLGSIAGAMILGSLGAKLAGFIRDFIKGDKEAINKAKNEVNTFLDKTKKVVGHLEQAGILSTELPIGPLIDDLKAQEIKARYSNLYTSFVQAHRDNRGPEAIAILQELQTVKGQYETYVRQAVQEMNRP